MHHDLIRRLLVEAEFTLGSDGFQSSRTQGELSHAGTSLHGKEGASWLGK